MTSRQLVIAALKAIDEQMPLSIVMLVARTAALTLESEHQRIAEAVHAASSNVEDILVAIDKLKQRATAAHQQTVLDRWERAAQKAKAKGGKR